MVRLEKEQRMTKLMVAYEKRNVEGSAVVSKGGKKMLAGKLFL